MAGLLVLSVYLLARFPRKCTACLLPDCCINLVQEKKKGISIFCEEIGGEDKLYLCPLFLLKKLIKSLLSDWFSP